MFTIHVYDLTCHIQRWRGQWLGAGDKAAKPMTAVQDCVSTFISLKPVDNSKETPEQFQTLFTVRKNG